MLSEKTSCRELHADSASASDRVRMNPGCPPCALYINISRFPPMAMILPPGRVAKESITGWAANVAPPSVLTDITIVNEPSAFNRCAHTQIRPWESIAISARA